MDIIYSMTISDLALASGVPASTIRYYLREGLIKQPLRRGKTRAYYSKDHLVQLKKLKKLRNSSKISINEIKRKFGVFTTEAGDMDAASIPTDDRKKDILTAAAELFRSKGYDGTNMDDLVEHAKISKATFYKHFNNKEDLFFECADMIFFDIDKTFQTLNDEMDIISRFRIRASLFIKTHRYMIDMLNIARGTNPSTAIKHKQKLDSIVNNLINPLRHDLDEGIEQGIFKKVNTEVMAHMLMGAAEYMIYYLNGKKEEEADTFIENSIDFILNGLGKNLSNSGKN